MVIEHIPDTVHLMEEIGRITDDGAIIHGATPHFSSSGSYADPTHCHHFACRTFDYLSSCDGRRGILYRILSTLYKPGPIRLRTRGPTRLRKLYVRLRFNRVFAWVGIERLANVYPELYEAFFSGIIPAREIVFQLKTVKARTSEGNEGGMESARLESANPQT